MSDPVAGQSPTQPQSQAGPDAASAGRQRLRRMLLASIAVLYVISVPWYRDDDAPLRVWFGLPDWVAVALGCYVAVAVLNAMAWWLTDVPEGEPTADGSNRGAS